MVRNERLAQVFVELADTLVANFDVIDFLSTLVDAAVELLGVQAAGLMLADQRGALQVVASTGGQVQALELLELQHEQGPCPQCYATGRPVVNIGPAEALARWPHFMTAAAAAGYASVHALPLRLRGEVIGAMNLFCTGRMMLGEAEIALGQALADVATIGLLQERLVREKTGLAEQLQQALNSRILLEQAKGVLAERVGLGMDQAFAAMRIHARRHGEPLRQVATAIIDGTLDTAALHQPG